jgi:uncharacterized protein YodC (DUF2158 family)
VKREPEPIGVGSIVRHKAGGPRMTVEALPSHAEDYADLVWFDTTNRLHRNSFRIADLVAWVDSSF